MKTAVTIKSDIPVLVKNIVHTIISENLADALDSLEDEAFLDLEAFSVISDVKGRYLSVSFERSGIVIRYDISRHYQCRIDVAYGPGHPTPKSLRKLISVCPRKVVRL